MSRYHDKEQHKVFNKDAPPELESQFVLRLPAEPANALREALQLGNLKDRLTIRLENDVRYGEVRVDHWLLQAKVVDLPTIIESLKTIDNKSLYKTADICQMLICKEEGDQHTDEESPSKTKKKDPNKVDKKFLWPHGVTPPTKNVRKRRFRKTLKKKFVEAPEIEKEVKRLLRVDNDAVNVKWELIVEDEDKEIKEPKLPSKKHKEVDLISDASNLDPQSLDIEQDIFGGTVSDSDEEETNVNVLDIDENSALSVDDTRLSDSNSIHMGSKPKSLITQFSGDMFSTDNEQTQQQEGRSSEQRMSDIGDESMDYNRYTPDLIKIEPTAYMDDEGKFSHDQMFERFEQLQNQIANLRARKEQQEMEIMNIENHALRQRFQDILDNLTQELIEKEQEYQQYQELLKF